LQNALRHLAIARAQSSSQEILHNIADSKNKNGDFPQQIDLSKYNTGICAYQKFRYQKSVNQGETIESMSKKILEGKDLSISSSKVRTGGFELIIDMPLGLINWDVLVYWPSERYPKSMKGGSVETFGKWAYVHE
jgi:hypothetical protein